MPAGGVEKTGGSFWGNQVQLGSSIADGLVGGVRGGVCVCSILVSGSMAGAVVGRSGW